MSKKPSKEELELIRASRFVNTPDNCAMFDDEGNELPWIVPDESFPPQYDRDGKPQPHVGNYIVDPERYEQLLKEREQLFEEKKKK